MEINLKDAVCFDTETSGLNSSAEICEISIVSFDTETTLFSKVLKTKSPIPREITAIHGITNEMSQSANSIRYYWDYMTKNLLFDCPVIGYNVFFDIKMMFQSYHVWEKTEQSWFNASSVIDVMQFAKWKLNSKKFLSLTDACKLARIDFDEGQAHGSEYDSRMTIRLLKRLLDK